MSAGETTLSVIPDLLLINEKLNYSGKNVECIYCMSQRFFAIRVRNVTEPYRWFYKNLRITTSNDMVTIISDGLKFITASHPFFDDLEAAVRNEQEGKKRKHEHHSRDSSEKRPTPSSQKSSYTPLILDKKMGSPNGIEMSPYSSHPISKANPHLSLNSASMSSSVSGSASRIHPSQQKANSSFHTSPAEVSRHAAAPVVQSSPIRNLSFQHSQQKSQQRQQEQHHHQHESNDHIDIKELSDKPEEEDEWQRNNHASHTAKMRFNPVTSLSSTSLSSTVNATAADKPPRDPGRRSPKTIPKRTMWDHLHKYSPSLQSLQFFGRSDRDRRAENGDNVQLSNPIRRDGLKNIGNSCYMNAALQALLSQASIVEDFLSPFWSQLIQEHHEQQQQQQQQNQMQRYSLLSSSNSEPSASELIVEFFQLIKRKHAIDQSRFNENKSNIAATTGAANLTKLKSIVDSCSNLFIGRGQQDSHEFLMEFIYAVNQQTEEVVKPWLRVDTATRNPCVKLINDALCHTLAPINRHFNGILESNMICQNCFHAKETKRENYRDFSLNIKRDGSNSTTSSSSSSTRYSPAPPETLHLQDLLREYFEEEEREVDCEHCQLKCSKTKVSAAFKIVPNIMIVQLKRFHFDWSENKFEKIDTPVAFPARFDLASVGVPLAVNYWVSQASPQDLHINSRNDGSERGGRGSVLESLLGMRVQVAAMDESDSSEMEVQFESVEQLVEDILFKTFEAPAVPPPSSSAAAVEVEVTSTKQSFASELSPVGVTTSSPFPTSTSSSSSSSFSSLSSSSSNAAVLRRKDVSETAYHLTAVVRHHGRSPGSGHFTCDTLLAKDRRSLKASDRMWERCNDSTVTKVSEEAVLQDQSTAYVLFYARTAYGL